MARKNLLAGLTTQEELPAGNSAAQGQPHSASPEASRPIPASFPGFGGGAIGAVSRSIEQIKAQTISELDPSLIDPSPLKDRLESSPEALEQLANSIRENGQQVPVLVRPHPERTGRYQIAYGRRRLSACVLLGRKVRAMVRSLSDQELVVAQGQENSARTDLSFIERALFAAQLEEAGYSRDVIMAALTVDKTGLSRLISSAAKVPRHLIQAVGAAPKAGRDRWIEIASRLERPGALDRAQEIAASAKFGDCTSDQRFDLIFAATAVPASRKSTLSVRAGDKTIATIKEDGRAVTLSIAKKNAGDFGNYLAQELPALYQDFIQRERQKSS
jgi:ParB family transcriptional regulator, chromosome partitioning protein